MPDLFNLYVRGLAPDATDEYVQSVFSAYGTVAKLRTMRKPAAGDRVAAFVRFESAEEAAAAQSALDQSATSDGQAILVRFADTPEERAAAKGESGGAKGGSAGGKGKGKGKGVPAAAAAYQPYAAASAPLYTGGGMPQAVATRAVATPSASHGALMIPTVQAAPLAFGMAGRTAGRDTLISPPPAQWSLIEHFDHPVVGSLRKAAYAGEDGANVYVWGIPSMCDEYTIFSLFAPFGGINSVRVIREAGDHNQHRGYGFVRFAQNDAAQNAIQYMNGAVLWPGVQPLCVKLKSDSDKDRAKGGKGGKGVGVAVLPQASPADDTTGPPAAVAPADGQRRVALSVPANRCGLLIGQGGAAFKSLTSTFGISLTVPGKTDPEGTPVVVEGEGAQVGGALQEISKMVRGECSVLEDSYGEYVAGSPVAPASGAGPLQ